eukprot:GHVR01010754.1.p1 GENE.GHVR01010754.1~~GHVR01010754.1.p1  ORF type:complete len:121 (-),score=26.90 GHVR01010754.1:220-582(-)
MEDICSICNENKSRYTCPGCSIKTCSAKCVTEHKKINNCNGKRKKIEEISLSEYTDTILVRDFNMLESIGQAVDNASRSIREELEGYNNNNNCAISIVSNEQKRLDPIVLTRKFQTVGIV